MHGRSVMFHKKNGRSVIACRGAAGWAYAVVGRALLVGGGEVVQVRPLRTCYRLGLQRVQWAPGAGRRHASRSVISPEIGRQPMSEWARGGFGYRSAQHGAHAEALPPVPPVVQLVHLTEYENRFQKHKWSHGNWKKNFQVSWLKLTYCSVGLLRGLVLYEGMQL